MEILQMWLNLPARLKMTEPRYIGLQKEEITHFTLHEGTVRVQLIAGEWNGERGSFETLTPIFLSTVFLDKGAKLQKEIPQTENVFFYIVRGSVRIMGDRVPFRTLVEFNNDGDAIAVEASEDAVVILGHARPFAEPMVAQGPFVMNTQEEIRQAYLDYQMGKFGTWKG